MTPFQHLAAPANDRRRDERRRRSAAGCHARLTWSRGLSDRCWRFQVSPSTCPEGRGTSHSSYREFPLDLGISCIPHLEARRPKLTSSSSCCFESRAIFSISTSSFSSFFLRCRVIISRSFDDDSARSRATSAGAAVGVFSLASSSALACSSSCRNYHQRCRASKQNQLTSSISA